LLDLAAASLAARHWHGTVGAAERCACAGLCWMPCYCVHWLPGAYICRYRSPLRGLVLRYTLISPVTFCVSAVTHSDAVMILPAGGAPHRASAHSFSFLRRCSASSLCPGLLTSPPLLHSAAAPALSVSFTSWENIAARTLAACAGLGGLCGRRNVRRFGGMGAARRHALRIACRLKACHWYSLSCALFALLCLSATYAAPSRRGRCPHHRCLFFYCLTRCLPYSPLLGAAPFLYGGAYCTGMARLCACCVTYLLPSAFSFSGLPAVRVARLHSALCAAVPLPICSS